MRRVLFTMLFLGVALVRTEGQTFGWFTNKYGAYGTNFISIAPWTAQGIFYEGDTVTISNTLGTTVEVYDYHFNPITNSTPPVVLTHLGLGHYFVQVDGIKNGMGDRSQFSVLPQNWTNQTHSDIGELPTGTTAESNRLVRLAPGFSRIQQWWGSSMLSGTNTQVGLVTLAGTNDWTTFDRFLHGPSSGQTCPNPNVPVKVMNLIISHTNTWCAPVVDQTNTLNNWVNDVALIFSNAAVRYGTNLVYEIMNEPSGANIDFRAPANEDPYWNTAPGALPAAMAVSAAVQAVKFVCPTCQTWAPASLGLQMWPMRTVTDSFVIAYYTNVDVISFHGGGGLYGPADADAAYTNRTDLGSWWSTDSCDEFVASLYPGKKFAVTESYPYAPDVLGKTNSWWLWSACCEGGYQSDNVPNYSWDWRTMTMRFWKNLIEYKATGVLGVEMFLALSDADMGPRHPPQSTGWVDGISAWNVNGQSDDQLGCGPKPTADGQVMISWWLNDATLITKWLSGSPLLIVDSLGGYRSGETPGLHFYEWQFADGSTNTVIWADEETTVTTNLGVGLTDIWSNQWTGPIGIEPVIAWNWPNNSLGGSFSIVPVAASSATPAYGPAPMVVTFTDVSTGAISNRYWQFSDGFVTNTPNLTVVHQYTAPGSNTVQLTVSGPCGASTTTQSNMVIVTTFPPPLSGGNIASLPPFTGGTTSSNTGGTNSVPANRGSSGTWRFLITY